jgi:hypothetical protein
MIVGSTRPNRFADKPLQRLAARAHMDLVLGHYSVHTSPDALRDAEANISAIRTRLVQEGRL